MASQLMKFPEAGGEWEEVDGVGLTVLAALPRDSMEDAGRALTDAAILRPASGLMLAGSQFWSTRASLEEDERLLERAGDLFGKAGPRAKNASTRTSMPKAVTSVAMEACIRLGGLAKALRSQETGKYWRASQDDLEASGFLTLHQLHVAFGRAPLILTFVDDGKSSR